MEYFKNLSGVSILVVFILIFLPLLQVMAEEKLKTDTNEGNTESMKNEGATDYTISIRTTGDKITLYTDSKLIGKTPLTLALKEGESLQIYGKNNKDDIVFKTTLEGGKTPAGLLFQTEPSLGKKSVSVIVGVSLVSLIYLMFFYYGLSNLG
jgi:hypothetical protein